MRLISDVVFVVHAVSPAAESADDPVPFPLLFS